MKDIKRKSLNPWFTYCGMQEHHDNIGDLDGPEEKERAQARTKEIIAAL